MGEPLSHSTAVASQAAGHNIIAQKGVHVVALMLVLKLAASRVRISAHFLVALAQMLK